jgi:hypothetical protein
MKLNELDNEALCDIARQTAARVKVGEIGKQSVEVLEVIGELADRLAKLGVTE